ncbi:MAG: hypothetical protein NT154_09950 [Verrucomicrobia bacterium]|nr:hypothetical protein [Verrucomicrobiota bacterium]
MNNALAVRDFETARVASERLLVLDSGLRQKNLFNLAMALGALGREKEAVGLLANIAPADKSGYISGHLFVAQTLLARTNLTPQDVTLAEQHLKRVVARDPQSAVAKELLGRVYIGTGQWSLAGKYLSEVVSVRPETALLLAGVSKAQGDTTGTRGWAQRAAKFHREKVEASKLDDPVNRLAWADATAMLEDYPPAFLILEAGWRQHENQTYLSPMGKICALWVDLLDKSKQGDLAARVSLIQRGLECAPQNETLLRHLVRLTHLEGPAPAAARSTLNRLLTEGRGTAVLHFTLGVDAWERGRLDEARQHFALAYESAPQLPFVANNMGLILSVGDKPDLPRALVIIESVLQKTSNNPNFRETRGEIFVRLGRWQEGVRDLEFALPLLASQRATHKALAEGYSGLGLRELAAEHERLAKGPAEEKPKSN